jgi:hypothetical protein
MKFRKIEWAGYISRMGRNEECMQNFDEELPGKFTLGKSRRR